LKEIDYVKEQYSKDLSESCFKLDSNIEKQTNLEIDLLKLKSKLDEAYSEINELKETNSSQKNLNDLLKQNYNDKENQFNDLQESYCKLSNENKNLVHLNNNEKYKLQLKYTDLHSKVKKIWNRTLKNILFLK
jgi:hypothetical protein